MKSISIFILLLYWSVIIFAPVLAKNNKIFNKEINILPKIKPNK